MLQWIHISAALPFFFVDISSDSCIAIRQLKDWKDCQDNGQKVCLCYSFDHHKYFVLSYLVRNLGDPLLCILHAYICSFFKCFDLLMQLLFGFYDHGCHQDPGWALRNYIAFLSLRLKIEKIQFLCYREKRSELDLEKSLIGEASFPQPHGIMIYLDKNFYIAVSLVVCIFF